MNLLMEYTSWNKTRMRWSTRVKKWESTYVRYIVWNENRYKPYLSRNPGTFTHAILQFEQRDFAYTLMGANGALSCVRYKSDDG